MNPDWVVPIDPPRPLNSEERRLLNLLLSRNFPGSDALREQVSGIRVSGKCRDDCGSIMFTVDPSVTARYNEYWRAPVSIVANDIDEIPIEVLIHVIDGELRELEVVRFDYEPVKQMPNDESFHFLFPEVTSDGKITRVENKY